MNELFMFDEVAFQVIPNNRFKNLVTCKIPFICYCGNEVHKNELYYSFKPAPTRNKFTKKKTYHKWQKTCYDCEPKSTAILLEIEMKARY